MAERRRREITLDSFGVAVGNRRLARRLAFAALGLATVPALLALVLGIALRDAPALSSLLGSLALGSALGLAPLVGVAALVVAARGRRTEPGALAVEGETLRIERAGATRTVPEDALAAGWVVPGPGPTRVELETKQGEVVSAEVASVEVARELLEGLGLDARHRAVTMGLGRGAITGVIGLFSFLVAGYMAANVAIALGVRFGWRAGVTAWLVASLAGAWGGVGVLGPARVTIGADGVVVRHRLRTRFVPFARLARVELVAGGMIAFHLVDEAPVVVPTQSLSADAIHAVLARIEEVRAEHARGAAGVAPVVAALLARQGDAVGAWVGRLRALVAKGAGYRDAGVTRDDVGRVLEDPASSAEHRIAAALALAADGDPGDRERVRVAAGACASEPVRVALERIADGAVDDEVVERALAARADAKG